MGLSTLALQRISRSAAGLAGISGGVGFLALLGAFGPVSCWTSSSGSSTDGTTEVSRGCEAGIDYLFGTTTGNASMLFFWAVVLLVLATLGGATAWTGHRYTTWLTAATGGVISIVGLLSIGWYFVFPTLCLVVAGTALTVSARRDG